MSLQRALLFAALTVPILYVASCSYVMWDRGRGYAAVQLGDSEQIVLAKLGEPSLRTPANVGFPRYGEGCKPPCASRWWYENRLFLDIVAWSVDLDDDGKVRDKYVWSSP